MQIRSDSPIALARIIILIVGLIAIGSLSRSEAQEAESLDELRKMWNSREEWNSQDYANFVPKLEAYRKQENGKRLEVDYMRAASLCRNPLKNELGKKRFLRLLYNYKRELTDEKHRQIVEEKGNCGSPEAPITIAFDEHFGHGAGVGKTFHWVCKTNPVSSGPAKVVKQISDDVLKARLFNIGDAETAKDAISGGFGNRFPVGAFGHFVLVSQSGHSPEDLASIGRDLDRTLDFYVRAYNVTPPRNLITVHLLAKTRKLKKFAWDQHGLKMSISTIGYIFQDDNSIVGLIPDLAIGTLLHELFHLTVRTNFGDIPSWMDEGLAALYEVSLQTPDGLLGVENWRRRVLEEVWQFRPTVRELVSMEMRDADDGQPEYRVKRLAATEAMARYFFVFLQQKYDHFALYRAFRDRPFDDLPDDPKVEAVQIVERTIGRKVSDLDAEFVTWFQDGPYEIGPEGSRRIEKFKPVDCS
jgi:hypothetical protein